MTSSGTSVRGSVFSDGSPPASEYGPITSRLAWSKPFGDVVDAYEEVIGSAGVFRFMQLRARLSRSETNP